MQLDLFEDLEDLTDFESQEYKVCDTCNKTFGIESFYNERKTLKDGSRNKKSTCKECYIHKVRVRVFLHTKHRQEKDAVCEVCNARTTLVLDHCHKNDTFRGWLCNSCNTGIGKLKDDVSLLEKAIEYLNGKRDTG